jgi:hypothetical protein
MAALAASPSARASSPRLDAARPARAPSPPPPAAPPHRREGPTWENTYITKPEGYGEARGRNCRMRARKARKLTRLSPQHVKFNRAAVSAVILQKFANRLEGAEYDAATAAAVRAGAAAHARKRIQGFAHERSRCAALRCTHTHARCAAPLALPRCHGCRPARLALLRPALSAPVCARVDRRSRSAPRLSP